MKIPGSDPDRVGASPCASVEYSRAEDCRVLQRHAGDRSHPGVPVQNQRVSRLRPGSEDLQNWKTARLEIQEDRALHHSRPDERGSRTQVQRGEILASRVQVLRNPARVQATPRISTTRRLSEKGPIDPRRDGKVSKAPAEFRLNHDEDGYPHIL